MQKADQIAGGEKHKGETCQCEWLSPKQLKFESRLRPTAKADVLKKWLF